MSIDLKGNTNYVLFRDKPTIDPVTGEKTPGPYIVPRTALSAIDMVAGNDIIVEDDTIRIREATVEDIVEGTTDSGVITAQVLKDAIDQGYITPAIATVAEISGGTGTDTMVSPAGLKGSLTSGKAVDVTSQPSVSAGTLATPDGIKGTLTWTGSTGTFGFYDNSSKFPKYADGLVYLLMADVMNAGDEAVTISANNGLNDTLPITLTVGEQARIAFLFDTATNGYFTVTGNSTLRLTHVREFEVTGCTDKAREYVASVSNPDDFNAFYLVDTDTVNPWLYIINMHNSPVTTIQAGLAYKLYANDGEIHTLMVDTIPANYYGRDAKLELFVGQGSMIQTTAPLRLADGNSFTDNTLNNCSVRFQDGIATITVDSTESSYIVTVAGSTYTTEAGTLYSGINGSTATLLIFNSDTNGSDCNMYSATANKNKKLYGNGVANTIVTGTGAFGSYTGTFEGLTLKNATISGSAVHFSGQIAIDVGLTNNATVTVTDRATLQLFGATNSSYVINGLGGSIAFGDGAIVDASQNATGAVLISQPVVAGTGVTVVDEEGISHAVTNGASGSYLLSNGMLVLEPYTVSIASGSESGTLYSILTNNTSDAILFDRNLDGQQISVPASTTISTAATIVGNGPDRTVLTGGYGVGSGVTMKLSSLSVSGVTFSGAGTTQLSTVTVGTTTIATGSTLSFSGINNLNSTVSGAGAIVFADGATVTSTIPSGSTIGTGSFSGLNIANKMAAGNGLLENVEITGSTYTQVGVIAPATGKEFTLKNCYLHGILRSGSGRFILLHQGASRVNIIDCVITGNTSMTTAFACYAQDAGSVAYIKNSTIDEAVSYSGLLVLDGSVNSTKLSYGDKLTSVNGINIVSGSTVTVSQFADAVSGATNKHIRVGTYNASGTWITATTSDGQATVVVNGHTIHVWGSGTYINIDGTTDLQHD